MGGSKMKANELRIGNYVKQENQTNTNDYWKIRHLSETDNLDNLEPIPLTEQWLKDFGFQEMFPSCFKKKEWKVNFMPDGIIYFLQWNTFNRLAEIKYVHQLQNIYFAVTELELIKN